MSRKKLNGHAIFSFITTKMGVFLLIDEKNEQHTQMTSFANLDGDKGEHKIVLYRYKTKYVYHNTD